MNTLCTQICLSVQKNGSWANGSGMKNIKYDVLQSIVLTMPQRCLTHLQRHDRNKLFQLFFRAYFMVSQYITMSESLGVQDLIVCGLLLGFSEMIHHAISSCPILLCLSVNRLVHATKTNVSPHCMFGLCPVIGWSKVQ